MLLIKPNPEIVEAISRGIKIAHRSDLLNYFLEKKKSIAVAGTHGKTSTTAMITHMLSELNLEPSSNSWWGTYKQKVFRYMVMVNI